MALNKEVWIADIVEGFFPNNEFVSRSIDHSIYIKNRTVHVPNAGVEPEVKKNLKQFPATATNRTDADLTYDIDTYSSVPVHVPNAEAIELSYDKKASVISQMKKALQRNAIEGVMYSWAKDGVKKIATLGKNVPAHIPTATGERKSFGIADVLAVKKEFDANDVPDAGRYILLDAEMYNQLLEELTDAAKMSFLAGANPETGVVGQFMGFSFYRRSKALKTTSSGVKKEWSAAATATDSAAGIAWQEDCVSRAMGMDEFFINQGDALFYGDVMSCQVRAGGTAVRQDNKGVVLIYQGTAA